MDLETQTQSEQDVNSSTPEVNSVNASSQPSTEVSPNADGSPVAQNADGTPAWKPDFKFKVMDKEYEIDPLFQPIIKDEETLKKVKRLQEQALGLPHLEQSREEFKNKYSTALPRLQEYERVEQRLNKLSHLVSKQDFGTFFDELQIPKKAVLEWVKQEIALMEAPQHVQQAMLENRKLQQEQYELQQQNQSYAQQVAEINYQNTMTAIDQNIQHFAGAEAQMYNERMQNPNAFREYVIAKGQQIQLQTGQKAPLQYVLETVKNEFKALGVTPQVQQAPQPQVQQPQAQSQQVAPAAQKPTIPVVKAGNASPVQTPIKSMKDLKARAAAFGN